MTVRKANVKRNAKRQTERHHPCVQHSPLDASFLCQYFKSTFARESFHSEMIFPASCLSYRSSGTVEWLTMAYISRLSDSLFDRTKKMMNSCVASKLISEPYQNTLGRKGEEAGSGSRLHIKREFVLFFFKRRRKRKKKFLMTLAFHFHLTLKRFHPQPTKRQNRPVIRPELHSPKPEFIGV